MTGTNGEGTKLNKDVVLDSAVFDHIATTTCFSIMQHLFITLCVAHSCSCSLKLVLGMANADDCHIILVALHNTSGYVRLLG